MRTVVFILALVVALAASAAAYAAPAAILTAKFTGQVGFFDPIVAPGGVSSHEHCGYGVSPINTVENEASLRDSSHVGTWALAENRTAIWIPCVYEDGVRLKPFVGGQQRDLLAYYQPISGTECMPPQNMQGVTHELIGWRGTLNSGTITLDPPANSTDGSLVAIVKFRGARDFGVACFPDVKVYFRFQVGAGPIGRITIGGPNGGPGAETPREFHADYMFAHDRTYFQKFLDRCIIPAVACGKNPPLN